MRAAREAVGNLRAGGGDTGSDVLGPGKVLKDGENGVARARTVVVFVGVRSEHGDDADVVDAVREWAERKARA
uniref:Uncharacterized protein n=1 Tax=Mycena chlorophos TaxID=658473 RepID=A0ABQ0KU77_MYCCL|nr:predicted protein [Mycena chlorophos]